MDRHTDRQTDEWNRMGRRHKESEQAINIYMYEVHRLVNAKYTANQHTNTCCSFVADEDLHGQYVLQLTPLVQELHNISLRQVHNR